MKLVMTLLAKDEEDIIGENIEYHLSQGVDSFIAIDNASTDGTTDILREYEAKGVLRYIREEGIYSQKKWVTTMARMAHDDLNADWVINNDADEFWWPTTNGSLKEILIQIPPNYSLVRAKRHNMLIYKTDKDTPFIFRNIYRRDESINPIGRPLPPKICHRGLSEINVVAGNHAAFSGHSLDAINGKIEIFHYPVRDFEQLRRKTINIGSGYKNNPQIDPLTGNRPGIAQRTIYEEYKRDPSTLGTQYKNFTLNSSQLVWGLISGNIVKDNRLSKYFENTMGVKC